LQQPTVRTIYRAATLVMVFFVVSRLLGVVRDAVIAAQFGTEAALDAYFAAFGIPDLMFYVISGGALGSAFIPTFTAYLAAENRSGAWRLASAVFNWLLLILTGLSMVGAIFALPVAGLIAPDFLPDQKLLTAELMRWLLISTVIFGVSGLVMGIHHAHQHFLMPALAPVIYNLAIIGGAWLLGPVIGVQGIVVGAVIGAAGHLAVQLPALRRYRPRYRLMLAPTDPGVREVARLMGPRMVGLAAVQFNFVWDRILASGLTGGSISALAFGWRVMLLPQGIIAQAVASAAFPTFSALAAEEAWDELQAVLAATLRSILYLTIPATVGLLILGRPIIQILFERGNFTPESTTLTHWALSFYSLGLVPHAALEIVSRAFYAMHNTKTPVIIAIIAMGVNIVLSWLLMRVFPGFKLPAHAGIALASSIAVTVELVWLIRAFKSMPGDIRLAGLIAPLWRMCVAGILMGIILWGLMTVWRQANPWLLAASGGGLGLAVYGAATLAFGLEEPARLMAHLRRRLPI